MQKEIISARIIDILNKKLKDLKVSIRQTEEASNQAPGAMQSHSDTSKFQFDVLANNLRTLADEMDRAIKEIGENKIASDQISDGSIVKIEKDDKNYYYVISSISLEESFEIDGDEIRVVSINTPIAKGLMNKKAGTETEIKTPAGDYRIKIIEVY